AGCRSGAADGAASRRGGEASCRFASVSWRSRRRKGHLLRISTCRAETEASQVAPSASRLCAARQNTRMRKDVAGVWPVLATPFRPDGTPDEAGLRAIAGYALAAGVDGVVYPGVASEYESLRAAERARLVDVVAHAV